ncbi:MAG: hypothetical protein C0480_19055 [Bradyrhizobium sp.]|jgi:hypothetical protein|nr:hypothetical protein [Bradyrhizobium sp.]
MKTLKWLGITGALIVSAVMYVKMTASHPSVTVRYRVTLEAQVDGELKTASGVREVTYRKQLGLASQHELSIGFRGEAIALDLGSRGTLFALLKEGRDSRSGPEWIVLRAFDFDGGSLPRPVELGIEQVSRLLGKRELPMDSLPFLVRFRDVNDPTTVEAVNPFNIAEHFGPDAKLVRATLEIVPASEPITTGTDQRLKWLPKYYDRQLDGGRIESISAPLRLANSL